MENISMMIVDKAKKIEKFIIVSVFLLMIFLFSFGVLVREFPIQVVNYFSWIEEIVKIMNIFLVFITLGLALEKGKHVKIPILLNKLSFRTRFILMKVIDFSGFSFTLYLFFLSIELMSLVLKSGQVSPVLNVSMSIIYLAPTIGFLSISIRYFMSFFGYLDRFSNK
ncbi:TRAP transporter small permease [Marinomonas colpomeniae]|uniref:TRAP transporter small permease protein n=1 Tax=Marinomonas colpomeniae TaxID=2774408 RepID=A0ABR8NZ49_9GAMM|nr:TRAP transporter small permease [Marinomonas colpomeniae]MBD5771321.1 TRAP transporter small permease [Marinomonas colpomeniae]